MLILGVYGLLKLNNQLRIRKFKFVWSIGSVKFSLSSDGLFAGPEAFWRFGIRAAPS